ncbi:Cupredoxin [Lyophyllum atratum]|nr:Cupredoxin [Lyophyllum atratum]
MRFFAIAAAALFTVVAAENFTVLVGENGGLTYNPESVVAKAGDTIAFRFLAKNHTVTQSSFAKPCEPLNTVIDSGFQAVPAGATAFPEWSFTIDDDKTPFWFFCKQAPHCSKGMVFAVNPTAEKTFAAFKSTAMGAAAPAGSGTTTNPTGTSGAAGTDSPAPTGNSARIVSGNNAALLATLGLVAGLVL